MSLDHFKSQLLKAPKSYSTDHIDLHNYIAGSSNKKQCKFLNPDHSTEWIVTVIDIKSGRTHLLSVENIEATILQVKNLLETHLNLKATDKRLILKGRVLTDEQLVKDNTLLCQFPIYIL